MMTFGGVPILDWVILLVLIGFGIEAYITTRHKDEDDQPAKPQADATAVPDPSSQNPSGNPSEN